MKLHIYCVRDKKLQAFGVPQFAKDYPDQEAETCIRGLKKGEADKVPGARDCALYYFGTYEDVTGNFEILSEPQKLIDYEDYLITEVKTDGITKESN